MSSSPTHAEKRPSGSLWKRIIVRSATFGAGLAVAAALITYAVYWYEDHPRPARSWPEETVPSLGIKASLKTEWRDGQLNYQLEISPAAPVTIEAFDAALHAKADYTFFILLHDSSGFQLCEISAANEKHHDDDHGRYEGLSFNASDYGCSYSKYRDARHWDLSWRGFPAISNEQPPKLTVAPPVQRSTSSSSPHIRAEASPHEQPPATPATPTISDSTLTPSRTPGQVSAPEPKQQPPTTQPTWTDITKWRQLRVGMTESDVRGLLGEPRRIDKSFDPNGYGDTWWYAEYYAFATKGWVGFDRSGRVRAWSEP